MSLNPDSKVCYVLRNTHVSDDCENGHIPEASKLLPDRLIAGVSEGSASVGGGGGAGPGESDRGLCGGGREGRERGHRCCCFLIWPQASPA